MERGVKTYTIDEWMAEGKKRFGKDVKQWKFVCPQCKTVQTPQDLLDAGVPKDQLDGFIGFSCIGRFTKDKGCDWTLGGLFHIHESSIVFPKENNRNRAVFEFAQEKNDEKTSKSS